MVIPYVDKKKILNTAAAAPLPFQREVTKALVSITYYWKLSGKVSQLLKTIKINTLFIPQKRLRSVLCGFKHQYYISQSKDAVYFIP